MAAVSWTYEQSTGYLVDPQGKLVAKGYAGAGQGKNNPNFQQIHDIGPLPVGIYRIGNSLDHTILGPDTLPLTPDAANQMFGRANFFIHGDSIVDPGNASRGCIVMPFLARNAIIVSGDKELHVVDYVEKAISA